MALLAHMHHHWFTTSRVFLASVCSHLMASPINPPSQAQVFPSPSLGAVILLLMQNAGTLQVYPCTTGAGS